MKLLNVNRKVGADLIADVVDQSADNLVDGVTAGKASLWTPILRQHGFLLL